MNAQDCPRFNAWIRGCKFEARYDERFPDGLRSVKGDADAFKLRTYVRDVCIHCGRTIERQP